MRLPPSTRGWYAVLVRPTCFVILLASLLVTSSCSDSPESGGLQRFNVILDNQDDVTIRFQDSAGGVDVDELVPGGETTTISVASIADGLRVFLAITEEGGTLDQINCLFKPPPDQQPTRRVTWDGTALACVNWSSIDQPTGT